jgi:ketosteroid isomerase-like protein
MNRSQTQQFIERLNQAWLSEDAATLERLYHPDVVLLPPDAGEPIVGRVAVLASYREFHAAARVIRFEVRSLEVYEFAATTLVHMRFDIDFKFIADASDAPHQSEAGLEVYTLVEQPGTHEARPQIVWRAQFAL